LTRGKIVDTRDLMAISQQTINQCTTDKTCAASYNKVVSHAKAPCYEKSIFEAKYPTPTVAIIDITVLKPADMPCFVTKQPQYSEMDPSDCTANERV
jgi:hypothetical protein